MINERDAEGRERKSAARKKAGFEKWLDEPMVRLTMSAIPAADQKDALHALLQSAFQAGFNTGAGDAIGEIVEMMMRKDNRPSMPQP